MQKKTTVFILLFSSYLLFTGWVYTFGTAEKEATTFGEKEILGKQLWQKHNCISCHQLYGLGGFLGPDLTNAISDKKRGKVYTTALLRSGGNRMPNFHFSENEIKALVAYLAYADASIKNNSVK
jgi:nitric oxide reductase subunit C